MGAPVQQRSFGEAPLGHARGKDIGPQKTPQSGRRLNWGEGDYWIYRDASVREALGILDPGHGLVSGKI